MASPTSEPEAGSECAGSSEGGLEFYPPRYWGLDYHFHVYNKMYICDILEMQEYPHFTGAFVYNNHPIYKVDVVGVVVKKVENSKCFIYAVDDGTGVILCCCWKDNFYKQTGNVDMKSLNLALRQKVKEIQAELIEAEEGYSLGNLIQVKGKLKIFRDNKEIVANIHKKVLDPQFQVFRMCELPRLYYEHYDRPFQLPCKVQQAVNQERDGSVIPQMSIIGELKLVIFEYLSKSNHIVDIALNDLLQYAKIKELLSAVNDAQDFSQDKKLGLLFESLSLLEDEGHVTRRNDRRNIFEVLLHKSKLEKCIMNILLTESEKPKYEEKGCHYLHILDELHKTLQYSKVKKEAVLFCLQKLEAQSDVIRTTHAHYLPCGD